METNVITKVDFFDFMRCFFVDDAKYQKLTQNAKKPHFFMWRRMMAIQYPVQMAALSGLDDVRIMDVLHKNFLTREYPKWLYTSSKSGEGKTAQKESLLKKYSRDILDLFMQHYNIEWKGVLDLEEFFPALLYEELDKLDEDIHPSVMKSKLTKEEKQNIPQTKKPARKGFTFKSKK